jgi:photosystem II stability/assembly factor-like uncharacterized protein
VRRKLTAVALLGATAVTCLTSVGSGTSGASAAHAGAARWQPLHGPEGGGIFTIAIDPSDSKIVYAGGWGNLFKSTNGGSSWMNVSGDAWTAVGALAIDPTQPSVVYAATDRGIAKTTDGGRRWRPVNTGLFDGTPLPPRASRLSESAVWSLEIDAQHPATLYATTRRGLYRTTDGGRRWQIIGPARFRNTICRSCAVLTSGYYVSFAIDANHAATIYASWSRGNAPSNLYESADGGTSWRRIRMSDPLSFSALALTASGTLLGTDPQRPGVYRSSDRGTTWGPSGLPGATIGALTVDSGSGAIYATTTSGAVFQTADGGGSWQTAPANLAYGEIVTDPRDPATSYATADAGLVKSIDHGHTWTAADTGIVSTVITTLALAPGSPATLYAGSPISGAPVFKSTNRGRTWHSASAGLGAVSIATLAVDPHHPRTIFAGTYWSGIFESADSGLHWSRVRTGLPARVVAAVPAIALDPQHPSTIYVGASGSPAPGRGSFLQSVDGGATWRRITSIPRPVQSLAIDPHRGSTVFAGTAKGGLLRSRDAGRSWQRVATAHGVPAATSHVESPDAIAAIAIDPLDPRTIYAGIRTGGILKSSDGGTTWAAANTGLSNRNVSALAVDPRNPRVLFASTEGGVFRSSNGAESWQPSGLGLPAGCVAAFAIDPSGRTVFAGTNGGGVVSLRLGG